MTVPGVYSPEQLQAHVDKVIASDGADDSRAVEAMARAIEHQYDYGGECLIWREQIEDGGGYKFTRTAMLSLARAALGALRALEGK